MTGAAPPGCSAWTCCARASAPGHELVGVDLPELDITDAERRAGGARAGRDPTPSLNCAAWTDVDGAETHVEQAHAVNADGAGNLARAAAQAESAARARVHRLCLRRGGVRGRQRRAARVRRVRPDRAAIGVRPEQARRRAPGAGGLAAPHRRAQRLAVRDRRAQLRRDDAHARRTSATRCRWSPTRSAARPGPATSRLRCLGCSSAASAGLVHLAGSRTGVVERLRRRDLPPGRGRLPRRGGHDGARWQRPAPRPAWSVLESEREDVLPLPPWQDGLAGYLAARAGMMRA